ncbi:hypothetical protein [Dictyobacter halimunensis]|uniref:hypothetical protein n=1 Tax=Dictyobacter halimunensis TaxID=3026934 RepID=UPI0030C77798
MKKEHHCIPPPAASNPIVQRDVHAGTHTDASMDAPNNRNQSHRGTDRPYSVLVE